MVAAEREIINRVEALSTKRGVSMAQVATAWILSKEVGILFCNFALIGAITAPIVGVNSEDRIKDMAAAIHLRLTEAEIRDLEEPYVPQMVTGLEIPPVNQGEGKR
jgi:aryl-alcohol dehydrogenase-like predicted oxidoreductase